MRVIRIDLFIGSLLLACCLVRSASAPDRFADLRVGCFERIEPVSYSWDERPGR